jgi:hypothetical protein
MFTMTYTAGKLMLRLLPLALASVAITANATTLSVPGASDIWLAGQPNGSQLFDLQGGPYSTSAPANSPVEIVTGGASTIDFSVTGHTSNWAGCTTETSPDGGACGSDIAPNGPPANGLSGYKGPINALIGVFTTDGVPGGPGAPPTLDFTTFGSTGQAFTTLSPLLNQIFFIGDGLTGTGSGAIQYFNVPLFATRLFLASSDGQGDGAANTGTFVVTYTTMPEPATLAMLGGALVLFGIRRRFVR